MATASQLSWALACSNFRIVGVIELCLFLAKCGSPFPQQIRIIPQITVKEACLFSFSISSGALIDCTYIALSVLYPSKGETYTVGKAKKKSNRFIATEVSAAVFTIYLQCADIVLSHSPILMFHSSVVLLAACSCGL